MKLSFHFVDALDAFLSGNWWGSSHPEQPSLVLFTDKRWRVGPIELQKQSRPKAGEPVPHRPKNVR